MGRAVKAESITATSSEMCLRRLSGQGHQVHAPSRGCATAHERELGEVGVFMGLAIK